jgi:hypothetical protein
LGISPTSFAPPDFSTSVTNQTADTVGDVADNASGVIGTTIDVARDVEQNATSVPQGIFYVFHFYKLLLFHNFFIVMLHVLISLISYCFTFCYFCRKF